MRYDKTLKIKMSGELKTTIKYYDKDYEKTIRKLVIIYLESLSQMMPEISDFYETVKSRMPEYFIYAKTVGLDDSFEEKFNKNKDKKISSLEFVNKLWQEIEHYKQSENDLDKALSLSQKTIKKLKRKLKQYENSKG